MSRVGKYPVPLPQGVQVTLEGRTLVAKGKLGELKLPLTDDVEVEVANNQVAVKPRRDDRRSRTMWGTTRSLVNGMVTGVSTAVRVEGADKQRVGQIAAEIRGFRGPEPYKGKGIKYEGEQILRKEGKKK